MKQPSTRPVLIFNYNLYKKLLLLRNHGLIDRDTVKINGFNSRLDTFQAVVGNWLLPKAKNIANQRIQNANFFDYHFNFFQTALKVLQLKLMPLKYILTLYLLRIL